MKRHKHTLSNYRLFTCNMGNLIPVGLQETLPGDTFDLSTSAMIRVSPLAAPVMHPVTVRIHHFFVPHRLVWSGFEDFITGGPDGTNATSPPTIEIGAGSDGLLTYFGIPKAANQASVDGLDISSVPIRGYNTIYNEYYRDQDLAAERTIDNTSIASIAWGKDYFTAARPWTQKGPDITLPLGTQAPISGLGTADAFTYNLTNQSVIESDGQTVNYPFAALASSTSPAQGLMVKGSAATTAGIPQIFADLTQAGAVDINDFRRAFALQRYQEARARYGSRYTEYLRYLGVTPSDARLQRPEYLGGGSSRVNFSEVLQTAQNTPVDANREDFGVGDLFGHGVAGLRHGRIRRFIEEHGYIHSFMSVRPKSIYMNGIHRTFWRRTKEDFYQRELEYIGQQAILRNEIYADDPTRSEVFGYADRYQDYKETPSFVAGEFADILDYWHMARELPDTTTLNEDFIKCVPTKRIHNVQTNHALWCMVNNHVVARRLVRRGSSSKIF